MLHGKPKGISKIHGKPIIGEDGQMHRVRCKICTKVGCKEKLLVPKLDGLHKHVGRRKCKLHKPRYKVGEFYISVDNQDAKERRYMAYYCYWQVILLSIIKFWFWLGEFDYDNMILLLTNCFYVWLVCD